MNFLFHFHLAARDRDSRVAGLGAMLPDIWRMADRRMRARRGMRVNHDTAAVQQLQVGVEHHLDTDRWFHRRPEFKQGVEAL